VLACFEPSFSFTIDPKQPNKEDMGRFYILLEETLFSILTMPMWIGYGTYGKQYHVEKEGT